MYPANDLPYLELELWAMVIVRLNRGELRCLDFLPLWFFAETRRDRMLQRAGNGGGKNSFGSSALQDTRAFGDRGTGRHHVIDYDDGPAFDPLRGGDTKRAMHILDSRLAIKSDLRPRWAIAYQHIAA